MTSLKGQRMGLMLRYSSHKTMQKKQKSKKHSEFILSILGYCRNMAYTMEEDPLTLSKQRAYSRVTKTQQFLILAFYTI